MIGATIETRSLFGLGDRHEGLLISSSRLRPAVIVTEIGEDRVSNALSQSLPPLPDAVLADVTEAFRSLETDHQGLADFRAARDSAERPVASFSSTLPVLTVKTRSSAAFQPIYPQSNGENNIPTCVRQ